MLALFSEEVYTSNLDSDVGPYIFEWLVLAGDISVRNKRCARVACVGQKCLLLQNVYTKKNLL